MSDQRKRRKATTVTKEPFTRLAEWVRDDLITLVGIKEVSVWEACLETSGRTVTASGKTREGALSAALDRWESSDHD